MGTGSIYGRSRSPRLRLESLEPRLLLSGITTADSDGDLICGGPCGTADVQPLDLVGPQRTVLVESGTSMRYLPNFTDPEIAAAGLTEPQARERFGDDVATVEWPMEKVDRARTDGDTSGLVKVIYKKSDGTPLGATIASERASDLINEWIYTLEFGLKVEDIAGAIHVYPSLSRANVKAGRALLKAMVGPAYDVPH